MDRRLKNIMENYKKVGVNEAFEFHCTQCGKCCINREDILLNPKDLFNIAKLLNMTPEQVVEEYCEAYIGDTSRMPIVRLKPQGSVKRCPLLKDKKCSVHSAKPTVCAMFPIGRCIAIPKEKWNSEDFFDIQIEYIFNDPGCGDKSETHTVKEWLEEFNIPLQDQSFLNWQKTIAAIAPEIHALEELFREQNMGIVWNCIFFALYLNYDSSEDYDSQFEDNSRKLLVYLKQLRQLREDMGNV